MKRPEAGSRYTAHSTPPATLNAKHARMAPLSSREPRHDLGWPSPYSAIQRGNQRAVVVPQRVARVEAGDAVGHAHRLPVCAAGQNHTRESRAFERPADDGHDASALTIPSALLKRRADLHVHAKFKLKGGRHARVSYNIRAVVRFMGTFYRRET